MCKGKEWPWLKVLLHYWSDQRRYAGALKSHPSTVQPFFSDWNFACSDSIRTMSFWPSCDVEQNGKQELAFFLCGSAISWRCRAGRLYLWTRTSFHHLALENSFPEGQPAQRTEKSSISWLVKFEMVLFGAADKWRFAWIPSRVICVSVCMIALFQGAYWPDEGATADYEALTVTVVNKYATDFFVQRDIDIRLKPQAQLVSAHSGHSDESVITLFLEKWPAAIIKCTQNGLWRMARCWLDILCREPRKCQTTFIWSIAEGSALSCNQCPVLHCSFFGYSGMHKTCDWCMAGW